MWDHWNKWKDQKKLEALRILPEQKWYEFDSCNKASYNCSVENHILFLISSSNSDGKEQLHVYKKRLEERTSQENRLEKGTPYPKRLEKKNNTLPKEVRFEKEPLKHLYVQKIKLTNSPLKSMTSWWLNQPNWKIFVKLDHLPRYRGENRKKYLKPPPTVVLLIPSSQTNILNGNCWAFFKMYFMYFPI